jgi:organic hydroperoxide reductase OsmC/OhrA
MAQTKVSISTVHGASAAVGWSNGRAITIDRSAAAGGLGIGFNGGELLLLSVGACYCNDLFREADRMNVKITNVHIEVEANWGGDPVRATDLRLSVRVEGPSSRDDIERLIRHADNVAEIPNSLRYGTEVKLCSHEAISLANT